MYPKRHYKKRRISRRPYRRVARGRGGYSFGRFIRDAKHLIGNRLINKGNQAIGKIMDAGTNLALSRIPGGAMSGGGIYTGGGAYRGRGLYTAMNSNNLVRGASSKHLSNSIPQMHSVMDETGAVCLTHREYITDVYAPGVYGGPAVDFAIQAYPLNPALQQTFMWLSQLAQNFEEYEFKQCIFHYRSTTSDIGNSTTGQVGTVIMATNYNAAAPTFTDKQAMVEYAHAHSCKITEHMSHGVECDRKKTAISTKLFTRANPVVSGEDLKTYDHGKFQIAIANCPTGFNGFPIGELWVEYSVVLRKPKLFVARGLEIDRDTYVTPKNFAASFAQTPMGTDALQVLKGQQNNIGTSLSINAVSGAITVLFPAAYTGALRIMLSWQDDGATLICPTGYCTPGYTGNVTYLYDCWGSGEADPNYYYAYPDWGSASNVTLGAAKVQSFMYEVHVYLRAATSGANNSVTITPTNGLTTGATGQGFLLIEQYNSLGKTASAQRDTFINAVGTPIVP